MEAYQERIVVEKQELDTKLAKLEAFMNSETFSTIELKEQGRLLRQFSAMRHYSDILGERVAAF